MTLARRRSRLDDLVEVDVEHVVRMGSRDRVSEGHHRLPEADRATAVNVEPDPWGGTATRVSRALPSESHYRGLRRKAQVSEAVLTLSVLVDVRAGQASGEDGPVVLDLSVAEDTSRGRPAGRSGPAGSR